MKILQSASRIVFVLMAIAVIGLTYLGKVEAKDFIMLTALAFNSFFVKSATQSTPVLG